MAHATERAYSTDPNQSALPRRCAGRSDGRKSKASSALTRVNHAEAVALWIGEHHEVGIRGVQIAEPDFDRGSQQSRQVSNLPTISTVEVGAQHDSVQRASTFGLS